MSNQKKSLMQIMTKLVQAKAIKKALESKYYYILKENTI